MQLRNPRNLGLPLSGILLLLAALDVTGEVSVRVRSNGARVDISWPAALTNAAQEVFYPEFRIEVSPGAKRPQWQAVSPVLRGMPGRSGTNLSYSMETSPQRQQFFRVVVNPDVHARKPLVSTAEEVFGYKAVFDDALADLGRFSVDEFATNAAAVEYLPQLTWDPTTAQYWAEFDSTDFHEAEYGGDMFRQKIPYNYHLNEDEFGILKTNGFVVCERMGSPTFGDAYYRLFNADLPVFVTCDSILHAWHRSFSALLEESEELFCHELLAQLLSVSHENLSRIWQYSKDSALRDSIQDADYLLTVARSLLAGQQLSSMLGTQDTNVARTLADIEGETPKQVEIFGSQRVMDFSQFKARGHYDASERLRRYFRTVMWLGRADLRLETFEPNRENDARQFGTVVVLKYAVPLNLLDTFERFTSSFFGHADGLTLTQLHQLFVAFGMWTSSGEPELPDQQSLTNLHTTILSGTLGLQDIGSYAVYSPFGPEQVRLARSFSLFGQKFTPDSWAMSQVVFDRVLWDETDPATIFGKVLRRKPSCLDVAYSVLGNNQVVPELVERIKSTNGVPFRDGYPYQHNLEAVRRTLEAQAPNAWKDNVATAWLDALRSLSVPTVAPEYPEAMRTRAWAMKNLNTQLASWTERRHDIILYAKQSYTEPLGCSYPAGFLEPRPEFFGKMRALAQLTAGAISTMPAQGTVYLPPRTPGTWQTARFDLALVKSNQLAFLANFSARMQSLKGIAEKELAQQPLTAEETGLFENLIERTIDYVGERRWNGWYPGLFYTNYPGLDGYSRPLNLEPDPGCDVWDPLVTDIHTDWPDAVVGDPGAVIHDAVGNPHMLLIAIDNGPDRTMYAGPVLSHYEFELPGETRLSDAEWKTQLQSTDKPSSPNWTKSYLVPGTIQIIGGYAQ